MSVNTGVVQQVVHALDLIYGTNTPPEQRRDAEELCQRLKTDDSILAYGIYLADTDNQYPPMVSHFGLQLIEHAIRHRWNQKVTQDHAQQLQDRLWTKITQVDSHGGEPLYIREKLVTLMVMLVIRMWPQPSQWDNLSGQLLSLYMSQSWEMALRIWQTLGEEMFVYDRDAVALVRKQALTNGIIGALLPKQVVTELYPTGYRLTTDPVIASTKKDNKKSASTILLEPGNEDGWLLRLAQHAGALGNNSDIPESQIVAIVDTISVFLDWAPIKALVAIELAPRLSYLLLVKSDLLRKHVVNTLLGLSRRNSGTVGERDAMLLEFISNKKVSFNNLAQAYYTTLPANVEKEWEDPLEALEFAKALAQIIANLVTIHWARKKLETNVLQEPEGLLQLLLEMAKDPRYTVSSLALSGWAAIIKHPVLQTNSSVMQTFSVLTEHTTTTLFGVCRTAHLLSEAHRNHITSINAQLAQEAQLVEDECDQFDSLPELRSYLVSEVRARLLAIVRGMCKIDPAGFVGWILPSLLPVFGKSLTIDQNKDELSVAEAAFMVVESILTTLDDREQHALEESDPQVMAQISQARTACYQLGQQLVQFECDDAQLIVRQLQTLPSFAFLLRPALMETHEARDLLFRVLQKCAACLKSSPDSTNDHTQTARRATASLVRIAMAIPDSLMLMYSDLSQLVGQLLDDPEVSNTVKSFLTEFQLTMIAGSSRSMSERKELAQPVVHPTLETLHEFSSAFQSPEQFMSMLGLMAIDQAYATGSFSSEDMARAKNNRNRLAHVLSTLHICLNRTLTGRDLNMAPLWAEYVGEMVPAILMLIRCLHSLWNPDSWKQLPWKSSQARQNLFGVLDMSFVERQSIIGNSAAISAVESNSANDDGSSVMRAIRHNLSILRELSYKCLGKLSHLSKLFDRSTVDIANNFTGCLFADAESIDARHWRMLLLDIAKPILEVVGDWPNLSFATSREQCLATIGAFVPVWLGPLFAFCSQRLDAEWGDLLRDGRDNGKDSVEDDIVKEKLVRDWTRAWNQVISDLLASVGRWFPEASQIEQELKSSSRISMADNTNTHGKGNSALGAFVLSSPEIFAGTLNAALSALQYKDTQAVRQALNALASLAPSLTLVALMPMYNPPAQAHASTVSAYVSRIQGSLTQSSADACSTTFVWLTTDLVNALVGLLCDPFLIDLQDTALVLLGDMVYYSASISSRMSVQWSFKNSSGAADQRQTPASNEDGSMVIVPVGDPGQVFRQAALNVIGKHTVGDDVEQAIAQVAIEPESKRRKALLKVAMQSMLAVEKSRIFENSNSKKATVATSANGAMSAPSSWTNRAMGQSNSVFDNDNQFDLGQAMP